jgi:hypothetical protein
MGGAELALGAPVSRMKEKALNPGCTIYEPTQEVPIGGECDVIVCGGQSG